MGWLLRCRYPRWTMNKLSAILLCQLYLLLVLLAVAIISALSYSLLALALLLVMLLVTLHPLPARTKIVITVAVIFLVPLVLAPLLNDLMLFPPATVPVISAVSILPAIYLLDDNLRQNTRQAAAFTRGRTGRHTTRVYLALFIATLVMLAASLVTSNPALLSAGVTFALYLLGILIRVLLTIPRLPINAPGIRKRVIAGTTADTSLDIVSRASVRLHALITPVDPWFEVTPQGFTLDKDKIKLNLSFTPPLSGPSHPQFQISVTDSRGFVQINQIIKPVELQVIPRARYAEWLATKYLEQTGTGTAAALSIEAATMRKRGIEYLDSRTYQAGDRLKDIDWKHTAKLRQLITKEYIEAGEKAAIIAVNLSVTDTEAADKLAFNLITAALTLARESIPTALAAYNHQEVVHTTVVTDPTEILKQALSLVKDIISVEFSQRYLEPPDIARLRRNIAHLKQAKSKPAHRLLDMLNFEYRAIEQTARQHPATTALSLVTKQAPVPAIILLVSQLNHDTEAIMVTTEKLSRREFTTIPIESR